MVKRYTHGAIDMELTAAGQTHSVASRFRDEKISRAVNYLANRSGAAMPESVNSRTVAGTRVGNFDWRLGKCIITSIRMLQTHALTSAKADVLRGLGLRVCRYGARGHVSGEDVVRVAVQALAGRDRTPGKFVLRTRQAGDQKAARRRGLAGEECGPGRFALTRG